MNQLIIINAKDNVATATTNLDKGTRQSLELTTGEKVVVTLQENIRLGHKVAIKDIPQGDPVYKYGEVIGLASQAISKGAHVHAHNVNSQRGRGDLNKVEE